MDSMYSSAPENSSERTQGAPLGRFLEPQQPHGSYGLHGPQALHGFQELHRPLVLHDPGDSRGFMEPRGAMDSVGTFFSLYILGAPGTPRVW